MPSWVITDRLASWYSLGAWEIFGRDINPVFGSYPSAIAAGGRWRWRASGSCWTALLDSLRPFFVGYAARHRDRRSGRVSIIGRFRTVEAAIGIYITAGYAMPLVALVPLLVLWLGLGFAVKVAVVFLMSVFPICINTWLGVTAVPKTLIAGRSSRSWRLTPVILRRIILPATLPLHHGRHPARGRRAVVAMVIAEFFTSISGLGAIIITSANNFDTATMFVPIVVPHGDGDRRLNYLIGRDRALGRAVAGGDRRARRIASLLPGEEIGEFDEILVLQVVNDLRHLAS